MDLIGKNIRLSFAIALLITGAAAFTYNSTLAVGEPDSLSVKNKENILEVRSLENNSTMLKDVTFSDEKNTNEVNSSNFSSGTDLKSKPSNQNEENMQDSYTGNTIFSSAMAIIYKLLRYFL